MELHFIILVICIVCLIVLSLLLLICLRNGEDLDSQYSGVLGHIDADQKVDQNKYKFLTPSLNAAKNSWKNIKTDVVTLQEGIKIAEKKEQDF